MHERNSVRGLSLVAAVGSAFLFLASGCAIVPKLEAPKLSVISLKMQGGDLFSQRVLLRMRVFNPNSRPLPIEGLNYTIEINDAELGNGGSSAPFTVPAMGEAEFDMQFTANLAGALTRLLTKRNSSEKLDYRLRGSVSLASGFLRRIPFDERGSVNLK
jgi:LEA14-like dessication related protein